MKTCGEAARFYLVFYGDSGSTQEKIHEALDYGVVKMNVDTDMQYAFTRAVAGQMFKNDEIRGHILRWYFSSAQARSRLLS